MTSRAANNPEDFNRLRSDTELRHCDAIWDAWVEEWQTTNLHGVPRTCGTCSDADSCAPVKGMFSCVGCHITGAECGFMDRCFKGKRTAVGDGDVDASSVWEGLKKLETIVRKIETLGCGDGAAVEAIGDLDSICRRITSSWAKVRGAQANEKIESARRGYVLDEIQYILDEAREVRNGSEWEYAEQPGEYLSRIDDFVAQNWRGCDFGNTSVNPPGFLGKLLSPNHHHHPSTSMECSIAVSLGRVRRAFSDEGTGEPYPLSPWTKGMATRAEAIMEQDMEGVRVEALLLPPDSAVPVSVSLFTKKWVTKMRSIDGLEIAGWLGDETTTMNLCIKPARDPERRRNFVIIAQRDVDVKFPKNPSLIQLLPRTFQPFVAVSGPCLVVVTNAIGWIVDAQPEDFQSFAEGYISHVVQKAGEEQARRMKWMMTDELSLEVEDKKLRQSITWAKEAIEGDRMESVLGLLLHENIARPIIVPVPIRGEKTVMQGLGGIGITHYLPSPSTSTMWEAEEFPLEGVGSGEEERVLAVGWYSIKVTTSVDHKSESRILTKLYVQGRANPTLNRLLGQGTEFTGHRGPLLLLRVNEREDLLDISSIHVPRVLHGLARYDSLDSPW
ncbi:hypothetical protein CC2G_003072 [Coprinopsis cinerea AmutBmut pab1-1]|nr:hypothetical protein CC2G_003072 [Coprinopsis cinerea AmutBmut pab1-1]